MSNKAHVAELTTTVMHGPAEKVIKFRVEKGSIELIALGLLATLILLAAVPAVHKLGRSTNKSLVCLAIEPYSNGASAAGFTGEITDCESSSTVNGIGEGGEEGNLDGSGGESPGSGENFS